MNDIRFCGTCHLNHLVGFYRRSNHDSPSVPRASHRPNPCSCRLIGPDPCRYQAISAPFAAALRKLYHDFASSSNLTFILVVARLRRIGGRAQRVSRVNYPRRFTEQSFAPSSHPGLWCPTMLYVGMDSTSQHIRAGFIFSSFSSAGTILNNEMRYLCEPRRSVPRFTSCMSSRILQIPSIGTKLVAPS